MSWGIGNLRGQSEATDCNHLTEWGEYCWYVYTVPKYRCVQKCKTSGSIRSLLIQFITLTPINGNLLLGTIYSHELACWSSLVWIYQPFLQRTEVCILSGLAQNQKLQQVCWPPLPHTWGTSSLLQQCTTTLRVNPTFNKSKHFTCNKLSISSIKKGCPIS